MVASIQGHVGGSGIAGCNFVAHLDGFRYEAEVVTATTSADLTVDVGTPVIHYTPSVQFVGTCILASVLRPQLLAALADDQIDPAILSEFVPPIHAEEPCPY